jgi:hypothetical protein
VPRHSAVEARVMNIDLGPEGGIPRAEQLAARGPPLAQLDPPRSDPREGAVDRGTGEGGGAHPADLPGWGWTAAPFSFSLSAFR